MVQRLVTGALALLLLLGAPRCAVADAIIAIAAPLSGPQRGAGEDMRRAAETAVAEINGAGGVLGERLRLAIEDDGCEKTKATAAARALADLEPAVVVGHPCSSAALAAAPVYAAAGLLFISPGARHPALTEKRAGKLLFRLAGRDDRQGASAAPWLLREASARRIALVHDRTGYARSAAEGAVRGLAAAGLAGALVLPIVAGAKDYAEVADRLEKGRIEAVFFAGYPAEAALVLKGMRALALDTRFLGSDSLATPDFAAALDQKQASVRVLLPDEPGPRPGWSPKDLELAASSIAARALIARTYAAIEAWALAAQRASTFEPARVATALGAAPLDTAALGPVSFEDNGDARVLSYAPASWDGKNWGPSN